MISDRAIARFWGYVDKTETCWLWTANTLRGYGTFRADRRTHRAHRLAWELARGPIPPGLVVDHLCRVKRCVNPSHLEVVPQAINVRRGLRPITPNHNTAKTHCVRGHSFSGDNLLVKLDGTRSCRACQRMRRRHHDKLKRAAGGPEGGTQP